MEDGLTARRAQQRWGISSSQGTNTPYVQSDDKNYCVGSTTNLTAGLSDGRQGSMSNFWDEISSIQENLQRFNRNVSRISDLHSMTINNPGGAAAPQDAEELEVLVVDIRSLGDMLKWRIRALERERTPDRDGQIRKQQTELVKSKFVEAIHHYQTLGVQYRQKYKQWLEYQYKIIKPDATPEEIRDVVEHGDGGHFFLVNASRYGELEAAYRGVQERYKDTQKIERTLAELAQLSHDMSAPVEGRSEVLLEVIDGSSTPHDGKDTEAGPGPSNIIVDSVHKKKWMCFLGILAPLLVITILVVVVVIVAGKKNNRRGHQAF